MKRQLLATLVGLLFAVAAVLLIETGTTTGKASESAAVFDANAFASLAAAGRPAAASDQPKIVTVVIHDFKFEPETLTVHAGDIVEWKNNDSVPHTATEDSNDAKPVFDSGSLHTGEAWRYVAQQKGTYNYTCTFHPNMEGKLIVQ